MWWRYVSTNFTFAALVAKAWLGRALSIKPSAGKIGAEGQS
jgi:hypothetical protein